MSVTMAEAEELRQDMLNEDRQCYEHECMMRNNIDYALTHTDFYEAIRLLEETVAELAKYEHEYDIKELIEEQL